MRSSKQAAYGPPSYMRQARAQSRSSKPYRKVATANELKRNCKKATDRVEELWIVDREPIDKTRIEGAALLIRVRSPKEAMAALVRRLMGFCIV